jgi:hypothetical protein
LCPISELDSCKRETQICDDVVGYFEAVHNVLDELDYFCCVVFYKQLVFDPLGKFVDCDEDVLKSTFGLFEWSDLIQPPACEWSGRRDAN